MSSHSMPKNKIESGSISRADIADAEYLAIRNRIDKLRSATAGDLLAEWKNFPERLPEPPRLEQIEEGMRLAQQNCMLRWTYSYLAEEIWRHHPEMDHTPHFRVQFDGEKEPVVLRTMDDVQQLLYTRDLQRHLTLSVNRQGQWQKIKDMGQFWDELIRPLQEFDRRNMLLAEHEAFGSLYNEPLVIARRLQLFEHMKGENKNFWEWLTDSSVIDHWLEQINRGINDPSLRMSQERLLNELAAIPGHRIHPTGFNRIKITGDLDKEGSVLPRGDGSSPVEILSVGDMLSNHGAFGASVEMPLAALHKDEAKIRAVARLDNCKDIVNGAGELSAKDYRVYFHKQYPKEYENWERWLGDQGLKVEDYIPHPIMPLNIDQVKRKFADLLESDGQPPRLILPENKTGNHPHLTMTPTTSTRTMTPLLNHGDQIKVPLPIHNASVRRHLAPARVHAVGALTSYMESLVGVGYEDGTPRIQGKDNELAKVLKIMPEPVGVYLDDKGDDDRYARGYFLGCLHRENPERFVGKNQVKLDLTAVLAPSPITHDPLIVDIWKANGVKTTEAALARFQQWTDCVVQGQYGLLVRYGVGLEAHQQNTALLISRNNGALEQTLNRDFADGEYLYAPIQALHGVDLTRSMHPRVDKHTCGHPDDLKAYGTEHEQDVFRQGMETTVKLLHHTMIASHLMPLIDITSQYFGVEKDDLFAVVRHSIKQTTEKARARFHHDEADPEKRAVYDRITEIMEDMFLKDMLRTKALATMRLRQTHTSVPVPMRPNPLAITSKGGTESAATR